jgi:hypothetical protein
VISNDSDHRKRPQRVDVQAERVFAWMRQGITFAKWGRQPSTLPYLRLSTVTWIRQCEPPGSQLILTEDRLSAVTRTSDIAADLIL